METRIQKMGVATGGKGIGKSFKTMEQLQQYLNGNPTLGILGRKVLVMDVNDEFEGIPAIALEHLRWFSAVKSISARRIRPINPQTMKQYGLDELGGVLNQAMTDFHGGLILLEDLSLYTSDVMPGDLIGQLCTNRHKDNDIMIHYQSISALTPKVWRTVNYIRMHKQQDSVDDNQTKYAGKYEILKLAEILIDKACETEKRFCLIYDIDTQKIKACRPYPITAEMKMEAIDAYIQQHARRIITPKIKELNKVGQKVYTYESAWNTAQAQLLAKHF